MSRRKSCNVIVNARECRGNHDKMIRKFLKKVKREGILEEVRERRYYMKPSEKRRRDRAKAERVRRREEVKRKRALERQERRS
jgi:small subunit ribosomal protein S21